MIQKTIFVIAIALGLSNISIAQLTQVQIDERANAVQLNTITTAVPFLMIVPDSRGGAMGDAGVATSADAASIHHNPAKLAFSDNDMELMMSYSPWLRTLVNDMNLAYLSGYKKISNKQAVAGALRFFSLGTIAFTDGVGTHIRDFKPAEFSLDVAFSQKLSERFAGGIAARFINSNLTDGGDYLGTNTKPGRSLAVDISTFYSNDDLSLGGKDATLNWGLNISNIGAKMSYTETSKRDFIPANLKTGLALQMKLDSYNSLTITGEVNKLLVPTPPIYNPDNPTEILAGKDPNVGTATAIFQSFGDAPGGFKEEMRELNESIGVEYWYDKQFAFRTGFFNEHYSKGNRQFITLGAGLVYNVFAIDMSYLISTRQQNPLENTLRFSLKFQFSDGNTPSKG